MTRIGVAVIENSGCVLVGVRGTDGPLPGMAEFPGGKCEAEESAAACAIRESLEETGLNVSIVELLHHTEHQYDHGHLDLSFFLCKVDAESPAPQAPFRWLPVRELRTLNFPEANAAVIEKLMTRQLGTDSLKEWA